MLLATTIHTLIWSFQKSSDPNVDPKTYNHPDKKDFQKQPHVFGTPCILNQEDILALTESGHNENWVAVKEFK